MLELARTQALGGERTPPLTVPALDLRVQYASIKDEIDRAIQDVVDSTSFVLGPAVGELEAAVAAYCECIRGVGVASGSDALLLALMAAGVGPGDEVITTPFTFVATANTVSRLGATPIFIDIEPDTLNMDTGWLESALSERTKAILPVHLFGHPVDMDPVMHFAHAHGLVVIEDAAQAIGARYVDRAVGSIGLAGCLSFYPSKNLGAYGDAGMVVTSDETTADRIDVLRRQGSKTKYVADTLGMNSRLDTIQAAVLSAKLPHLDDWNEDRRGRAARYNQLLQGLPLALPVERSYARHVYHQYTVRVERRDELVKFLQSKGIGTMIYYPVPLHRQPLYANHIHLPMPVSERESRRVLSLPMYPELTDDQQNQVVDAITQFLARKD